MRKPPTPEQKERASQKAKARYRADASFREAAKKRAKDRYSDEECREIIKKQSKEHYHSSEENKKKSKANARKNELKNREKNRDKKNKRTRDWRAANPEKVKGYVNREYDNLRCKEYRDKNPEKRKKTNETYREKNREELRIANAEYSRNHPEVAIRCQNKRRALKKNNGGVLSKGIIDKLFKLQSGKCAYCKSDLKVTGKHLDHIMPLVKGGANSDRNVQLLCPSCNTKKGAKHPIEFARSHGLLL